MYAQPEPPFELSASLPLTPGTPPSSSKPQIASVFPSPDNSTQKPSRSPASVCAPFRYACCVHVAPARVNTYVAPALAAELSAWLPLTPRALLASVGAPTAIVLPSSLKVTDQPN